MASAKGTLSIFPYKGPLQGISMRFGTDDYFHLGSDAPGIKTDYTGSPTFYFDGPGSPGTDSATFNMAISPYAIKDKDGQKGSSGQVLSSTGSRIDWIDLPSGNDHPDSDHNLYGSWTLKRGGSTVGNVQSGYGVSWNAGSGLSVSSVNSPFTITYSANFGDGNTQVARGDHEHIGTGISQINSPSVGFFSSYTFNTTTGAFSVSTASTKSTGSTMGHIYPYNTAKDLGNNFGSSPSGRWRKLYVHSGVDTSSDERLKENIVDIPYGLDYINSLVPKQYTLKRNIVRGCSTCQSELSNDETECPQCVEDGTEENIIDNLDVTGEAATKLNWGFIAQEMLATPPEPDIDLAIVDHNVSADSYGVNYQQFIAPLVKAVQELSAKNDELESRLAALEG